MTFLKRATYRSGQAVRALGASVGPLDDTPAVETLSPELLVLFKRMRRSEQAHSLRVLQTLKAHGHNDPDLLTAALLHDCGKSRYWFGFVSRVLVVLVKKTLPGAYARWATGQPRGWRRAFVIAEQHPGWSAEDMAAAGASEMAVTLARRHQELLSGEPQTEEERLLTLLQQADDAN